MEQRAKNKENLTVCYHYADSSILVLKSHSYLYCSFQNVFAMVITPRTSKCHDLIFCVQHLSENLNKICVTYSF